MEMEMEMAEVTASLISYCRMEFYNLQSPCLTQQPRLLEFSRWLPNESAAI